MPRFVGGCQPPPAPHEMAPIYASLVKEVAAQLDKFAAGRQCLDDFMEGASKRLQKMTSQHRKFVLDVISACVEHKKLLDVVINGLYREMGKILSRSDRSLFVVTCYLITFALENFGIKLFCKIVRLLDIYKMHTFLSFFFANLTTWIQEEWNSIYDAAYVEKQWIVPLQRWRPEIENLIGRLAVKISGGSQARKALSKTTKPREFSLTKPKPRSLPEPEPIPQLEKPRPVPNSTYQIPREIEIMEEVKHWNLQKAEELLYESNLKELKCANPDKSEHTKRLMAQIQEDLDSKLKFDSFQSSSVPHSIKRNNWSAKLNHAARLRKKELHNRLVEGELQRIEQLLEGAREPSSFLQWQREMREKDRQEELVKIEARRLEGLINEEAAAARSCIIERNQKAAQLKKEEAAELMQEYAEQRMQEEKELRELVQQVAEGHKNSKIAKEKLKKLKQNIVREVHEKNRELLRQALEEAQAELSRKFKIISEIRAIESLPHISMRTFDDTDTGGHELLGEMSLAELKQRLGRLREAHQREEQEKRDAIREEKERRKQQLQETLETIDFHDRLLAHTAAIRKEESKAMQELLQQAVKQDDRVYLLRQKLEEKRQERQRTKQIEILLPKAAAPMAAVCAAASMQRRSSLKAAAKTKKPHAKQVKEDLEERLEKHINEYPGFKQ